MADYSGSLARLIMALKKLPGIGEKTAQRLAYHVLKVDEGEVRELADALTDVKENIIHCSQCNNFTDEDPCSICSDERRDGRVICVVEQPGNVIAVEKTAEYKGRYHVLLGCLSPVHGVGPDDLKIGGLMNRIKTQDIEEIIIATNPTVEGETTAAYIAQTVKPQGVRVTRIAMGVPVGGDIEYADQVTISRAMENRREV